METEKLRAVVDSSLSLDVTNKDVDDDDDSGGEYLNDETTLIRGLSTNFNNNDDLPAKSSPYSSDNEEEQQNHYIEMPAVTLALPPHITTHSPVINNLALERPTTAKSPSSSWGPDVNDTVALQMSMQSSPPEPGAVENPYGSFESHQQHAYPFGQERELSLHSSPSPMQPRQQNTSTESPYGCFSNTEPPPPLNDISMPSSSPYAKFTSSPPSQAAPSSSGSNTEFKSYLQSARSALDENDFDVCDLLLRSLERISHSEIIMRLPDYEQNMSQLQSIQRELKTRRAEKEELSPDILDRAKHLATRSEIFSALELIIPHTR